MTKGWEAVLLSAGGEGRQQLTAVLHIYNICSQARGPAGGVNALCAQHCRQYNLIRLDN